LVERAAKTVPGDPFDPKTRIGPLISQEQLDRVMGYIARGREEGAELLCGGERALYQGEEKGYWLQPTIFDRVAPEHTIAREEIFGPVLATLTFSDEEEAVALANDTIYGVARGIQAGTVWINSYHPLDPASPFGGYKQSGYGRELGQYALDLYTQVKSVWVDLS